MTTMTGEPHLAVVMHTPMIGTNPVGRRGMTTTTTTLQPDLGAMDGPGVTMGL